MSTKDKRQKLSFSNVATASLLSALATSMAWGGDQSQIETTQKLLSKRNMSADGFTAWHENVQATATNIAKTKMNYGAPKAVPKAPKAAPKK